MELVSLETLVLLKYPAKEEELSLNQLELNFHQFTTLEEI
jgi:hypothetical protein